MNENGMEMHISVIKRTFDYFKERCTTQPRRVGEEVVQLGVVQRRCRGL